MPIIFTEGLKPDFPDNSFDSERESVKSIFTLLDGEDAYINPLEPGLSDLITTIDTIISTLEIDFNTAETERPTLEGFAVVPIDPNTGQVEVDPQTGQDLSNLPEGWAAAGFVESDINTVVSSVNSYQTENQLIRTNLATLKTFITTADDTFKLHNDLLSGLREDSPPGVLKPNQRGLLGLVNSITSLENNFGIPFTNYLEKVFGTLFTGDVTVANAQALLNSNIPGSYTSLGVLSRVTEDPFEETPTDINNDINGLLSSPTFPADILVQRDNFQTHITDDTNEYNSIVDKLDRSIQAFGIAGYIKDPYYKFMYTDVFGSNELNDIITDLDNGDIT